MNKAQLGARLLLSGVAALACQAAGAETLADAMAKAVTNHPAMASSRAALRQADEGVVQERAAGLGTISGSLELGASTAGGVNQGRGMALSNRLNGASAELGLIGRLPIYSGGQVRYGIAGAEQGVDAARASLGETEQAILLDAVTAYEDVRRDISSVQLARNNVRVINEQVRAARDRFEVGEVTRTDVSQAEARLAAARSNLANAVGALAASRQAYLAVVGELPDGLTNPPPIPPLPETLDAAIALALAEHPVMIRTRAQARAAEYAVKSAVGAGLPSVELEGRVRYSNSGLLGGGSTAGESNSASVTLTTTVPLWTGGAVASGVREAQAALAASTANIHAAARSIRQQTALSWAQLDVARASIRAANQQIRAAQIAFDGVREEATLGARTTLDVLDAEAELLSARVDLVRSRRDEYVAAYTLLSAIGKLTVRHLGLNVPGFDPESYMAGVDENPYEWAQDASAEPEGEWSLFDMRP
ncbi:TolC family outer membrane protein [Rhodovulum sp. DZ06]|uniref:TolC family outer membrane protein n=1 Tax=Rhodovulum sp. DZ06 TaxID=3425126 RepID=UPI003D328A15